MYDGKEDGIVGRSCAAGIRAVAKDEAKRISSLMPSASMLCLVWLFGISELTYTRLLKWISEVGSRQAVAENFGECAATRSSVWSREVVVNVILAGRGEEEKPVLLNLRTCVCWVAS